MERRKTKGKEREDAIVTVLTLIWWRNASETNLNARKKLLAVGRELINYIDYEAKKISSSKKIDLYRDFAAGVYWLEVQSVY